MRFQIVSLTDPIIIRRIVLKIARLPEMRREVFREVSRNANLQREILAMIVKQPALRSTFILELAKNLKIRRTILKLSDQR